MDKSTFEEIVTHAPRLAEYASLSTRIKKMAGTIVGPSRKELLAIAAALETFPDNFFRPSLARVYRLHRKGCGADLKRAAEIYGVSPKTLKQILRAMELGGLSLPESSTAYRPRRLSDSPRRDALSGVSGKGPEVANDGRSNEERMEESIRLVTQAVANLKAQHPDWRALGARARIRLLKQETLKIRNAAISTQTLYQEWIKPLWQT